MVEIIRMLWTFLLCALGINSMERISGAALFTLFQVADAGRQINHLNITQSCINKKR